jgi:uncharacterized protein (TIGR02001 family)
MFVLAIAGIAGLAGAGEASAQIESEAEFAVSSDVAIVSDYRFRGWSLSDDKPALQVEADVSHASGLYAGVFASSIREYGVDADGDGATAEVDLYGGWAFALAGFDFDVGAMAYMYPDASDVNYYVIPVSMTRAFGEVSVTAGYEFTPRQTALGDDDSAYAWIGATWTPEFMPIAVTGAVGREDGAWAPDGKTDWTMGATYSLEAVDLGLSYVDSDEAAAGSAVIAEVRSHF